MLTDELGDEAAARRLGDERLQERERRVAAAARRADGLLDDVEAAVENSRSDEAFVGLQEPEQPGSQARERVAGLLEVQVRGGRQARFRRLFQRRGGQRRLELERVRRSSRDRDRVALRVDVVACVEIKISRRVRAEPPRRPPRHRHDACSIPDTLVDFHTGPH